MISAIPILSLFTRRPERITAEELLEMIGRGERVTLLDVRTSEEYCDGHIPGGILASSNNLKYMEDYSFEGKIVLYCTAGVRSYRASKALAARGIGAVDLEGGINSWEEAGGLIETGR